MSDDIKRATGDGLTTPETRKAVHGWHAIQQGKKTETRQQRILREQEEKSERVKKGLPAEEDKNFKPGQEESSGEFSMKKMRDHVNSMTKKNLAAKTFTGNAQLCMAKLSLLFCGDDEIAAATNLNIIKVEEAGFGVFKITYTCD